MEPVTDSAPVDAVPVDAPAPADTPPEAAPVAVEATPVATVDAGSRSEHAFVSLYDSAGTALIAMAATDVANDNVFTGEFELIVRTNGASGTVVGVGTFKSIPAAEGTMTIKDDILASTAIDTTVAQNVCVTATWSVASASNSVRLDVMRVDIA
jgi:hypothetical protein